MMVTYKLHFSQKCKITIPPQEKAWHWNTSFLNELFRSIPYYQIKVENAKQAWAPQES